MALKIRLKRMGSKGRAFYRVVVADSRSPRDGRVIARLGHYDPMREPAELKIDAEKARAWMARGAKLTPTAKSLFAKAGIS